MKLIRDLNGKEKARCGLVFVLCKFWVENPVSITVIKEHRVVIKLVLYDKYILANSPGFPCDAPTRHRVSSEGTFFFSRINFKLVHSYNVKKLTCIIFCSIRLQNIYTSSMYGSVQYLQYLHWFTKFHIQNRPKDLPVGTY